MRRDLNQLLEVGRDVLVQQLRALALAVRLHQGLAEPCEAGDVDEGHGSCEPLELGALHGARIVGKSLAHGVRDIFSVHVVEPGPLHHPARASLLRAGFSRRQRFTRLCGCGCGGEGREMIQVCVCV